MGSSRLPGKVLFPIGGMPVIEHVLKRARRITGIDRLVIATTNESEDDAVATWASENSVACYRGSVSDVVLRFLETSELWGGAYVARITADCPLIDPELCSKVIGKSLDGDLDFCSNYLPPSFPDGMDFSVFRRESLREQASIGLSEYHREHVTTIFEQNQGNFSTGNVESEIDRSSKRWTLDNFDDYEFLVALSDAAGAGLADMRYSDILALLEKNPHIEKIQSTMPRNYGHLS
jgi:spore coat polysaccharide biosynthesis protein SpsF (cytidylyltransferase family)